MPQPLGAVAVVDVVLRAFAARLLVVQVDKAVGGSSVRLCIRERPRFRYSISARRVYTHGESGV